MKITIVSFQKNRNSPLEAAEQEYLKRLGRHVKVEFHTVKSWTDQTGLPAQSLKAQRCIGLFIEGKCFSSPELAQRLQILMNQGVSHLAIVIGGPEGIPAQATAQIQERWSLSSLTFSHQLARVLLLEALYRSFDILHGGRYHK